MSKLFFQDQDFDYSDIKTVPFSIGEYDHCTFRNGHFSNGNFGNSIFIDCTFISCNLTMCKLHQTAFRNVIFDDSKLIGLQFDQCNPFLLKVEFKKSILSLSNFYQVSLKKCLFTQCEMHEIDFTEADFSQSVFDRCDLHNSIFDGTNLEKSDFSTAFNYSINPTKNRITKAKFSVAGLRGLLASFNIEIE